MAVDAAQRDLLNSMVIMLIKAKKTSVYTDTNCQTQTAPRQKSVRQKHRAIDQIHKQEQMNVSSTRNNLPPSNDFTFTSL